MKAKKLLLLITMGVMLGGGIFSYGKSFAINNNNEKIANEFMKKDRSDISNALGMRAKISVNDYIKINGEIIPLYCTFESGEEAIKEINIVSNELINKIKDTYNIDEDLTNKNIDLYEEKMNQYIEEFDPENQDAQNYYSLDGFFEIYNHYKDNEEIKDYASTINQIDEKLIVLLPYDTNLTAVREFNEEQLNASKMISNSRAYSVSRAIVYANRYATSPNKDEYAYFSGKDCTNFVSQILEAAGVNQVVYSSEKSGWWHKKENNTHTHSISWINAATFARYMGIGYRTTSLLDFTANIQKGDFIGYDKYGDGSVDHNAFVVDKDDYQGEYNGKTYYDFKVAEHSGNYCAWTSSRRNNWEKVEDGVNVFVRVRR